MDKKIYVERFEDTSFTIDDLSDIHLGSLFPNDKFSKNYLNLRMNYVNKLECSITLVAFNSDNQLLGIVYGAPEGYKNKMNKDLLPKVIKMILLRPYMILNKAIISKFSNKFKSLFQNDAEDNHNQVNINSIKLEEPVLRLTGIVTYSHIRSKGVGKLLLDRYITEAKNMRYGSIILNTPTSNSKGIKFYQRNNWNNIGEIEEGKTFFIKDLSKG